MRSAFLDAKRLVLVLMTMLFAAPAQAIDPFWTASWTWAIVSVIEASEADRFTEAPPAPGPDITVCHDEAAFVEAGGLPDFHIEITGHCAVAPSSNPPADFSTPWQDVTWSNSFDYETGIARERAVRDFDSRTLYDVTLQCGIGDNPFIHTSASCTVQHFNREPAAPIVDPLPLSGVRLDSGARNFLAGWESDHEEIPEGDGMDLAPNADPPIFKSPAIDQNFPTDVLVHIAPSPRGVAKSTLYEAEFYFEKLYPSPGGNEIQYQPQGPLVFTERVPALTREIDWSSDPDGITYFAHGFQPGHWTIRARMKLPGAQWSALVPFTAGVHVQAAVLDGMGAIGGGGSKKHEARPFGATPPVSPVLKRTPVPASPVLKRTPVSPRFETQRTPNAIDTQPEAGANRALRQTDGSRAPADLAPAASANPGHRMSKRRTLSAPR